MSVESPPKLLDDEVVALMREIRQLHREHIELVDDAKVLLSRLHIEDELARGVSELRKLLKSVERERIAERARALGWRCLGLTLLLTLLCYVLGFALINFALPHFGHYDWAEKAFTSGSPLWWSAWTGWIVLFTICGIGSWILMRRLSAAQEKEFEEGFELLLKTAKPCIEVHYQVKSDGDQPVRGFRMDSSNAARWIKSSWPSLGNPRENNLGVSLSFYDGDTAIAHYPLSDTRRALKDVWFGRQFGADLFAAYHERILSTIDRIFEYFRRETVTLLDAAKLHARSQALELRIKERQNTLSGLQRREALWNRLILDPALKNEVYSKVRLFERGELPIRGILLFGPPGTGKTLIAKTIAETINARFMPVTLSDLKRPSSGATAHAVRELFGHARDAHQAVIFIDECDAVFPTRDSMASEKSLDELVSAFLAQWDGINKSQEILVIGATNRRERIDPAILSRFNVIHEIPLPDEKSRAAILKVEAKRHAVDPEVATTFAEACVGFSGRDIENLVIEVATDIKSGRPTPEAFKTRISAYRQRASDRLDEGSALAELVLSEENRQELSIIQEFIANPDKLRAKGFAVPRSAFLYGPAGTGKTSVARALARQSGFAIIAPTPTELRGTADGQGARLVRELFQRARTTAPCVVCLDELDVIAPRRSSAETPGASAELVAQLLQELESLESTQARVFVLGISDRPQDVDETVVSRFGKRVQLSLPDGAMRAALFSKFIGERHCSVDRTKLLNWLKGQTEGKNARDIRGIVLDAEHRALARSLGPGNGHGNDLALTPEDFERAISQRS